MIREERPIVYTITEEDDSHCKLYTTDNRVEARDRMISSVANSKLVNTMIVVSTLLNNEGYAVLFEVN